MIKMIAPVTAGPDVRLYQHFFDTSCLFLIIFLGFFLQIWIWLLVIPLRTEH